MNEGIDWLEKVMSVVQEGIVIIQDEDIIQFNPAFAALLDYEEDELLDLPFEDIIDSLSKRHDRTEIDALFEGKTNATFSTRLVSKKGDIIQVEINPTNVVVDGAPAILAAVKDLSRQIELETAVIELENRFATLYDMSPIAYFTLNRSGVIEQVNEAGEVLFGCTGEEIIGKTLDEFTPDPEDKYNPGADIIREVLRGKSIGGIELEMKRNDGRSIWVNVSSRALDTDSTRPTEIGLMAVDISRRKGAEERLKEERERANLYLEIMTNDLNVIHHNALFALEEMNMSSDLTQREQDILTESSWNIRRASRLIANMRVLLALRHSSPTKSKTDLYPHIKRACSETDRDFDTRKLVIDSDIKSGQYEIVGHAFLWNAFFNIIHNTMMFDIRPEVEVKITAKFTDVDDMVRIEFIDNGPGILDDRKTHVFKRPGTSQSDIGRGLGLTVADRYIDDLGGKVWIEDTVSNEPSKGCKVISLIPLWVEEFDIPPITFYKSEHCVFCSPVLESLTGILQEMGINTRAIDLIDIDDPSSGVSADDLPALPTIRMGAAELTGFVPEDDLRSALMTMMMTTEK